MSIEEKRNSNRPIFYKGNNFNPAIIKPCENDPQKMSENKAVKKSDVTKVLH